MEWFHDLANRYGGIKNAMSDATGASEELLHVHFGLLIFIATAVVFRRRMHSLWPVALVWTFAIGNELIDYLADEWVAFTSFLDVVNTIFWPTMLFLVARRRRISPPLGR